MKRIDTTTRAIDANGPGRDGFANAVPSVSPGTEVDDSWLNILQEEMCRALEIAGVTLDAGDDEQLGTLLADKASLSAVTGIFAGTRTFTDVIVTNSTSTVSLTATGTTSLVALSVTDLTLLEGDVTYQEGVVSRCVSGSESAVLLTTDGQAQFTGQFLGQSIDGTIASNLLTIGTTDRSFSVKLSYKMNEVGDQTRVYAAERTYIGYVSSSTPSILYTNTYYEQPNAAASLDLVPGTSGRLSLVGLDPGDSVNWNIVYTVTLMR